MGARSRGLRACTRDLFSKRPRDKGYNPPLSTFLKTYKVGDTVDIVCNAAQQKGMPFKFYHGRTGTVWNVTRRGIGVEVNKVHREKQRVKRVHVRVEHLRPSKSKLGHLQRVKDNEAKKAEAKKTGVKVPQSELKRQPKGPRVGFTLDLKTSSGSKVHLLTPVPYVFKPLEKISPGLNLD